MSDAIETAFPESCGRVAQACDMLFKYLFLDGGCTVLCPTYAGNSEHGGDSTSPLLCAEANG